MNIKLEILDITDDIKLSNVNHKKCQENIGCEC